MKIIKSTIPQNGGGTIIIKRSRHFFVKWHIRPTAAVKYQYDTLLGNRAIYRVIATKLNRGY